MGRTKRTSGSFGQAPYGPRSRNIPNALWGRLLSQRTLRWRSAKPVCAHRQQHVSDAQPYEIGELHECDFKENDTCNLRWCLAKQRPNTNGKKQNQDARGNEAQYLAALCKYHTRQQYNYRKPDHALRSPADTRLQSPDRSRSPPARITNPPPL
jgi:hypothetical protein